ncbi:MAG: ATP-binding protein [Desulfobacteraceae bacterium]|nr:MAG: ATP-binding protein [Desulfobacteraceae bacterium]
MTDSMTSFHLKNKLSELDALENHLEQFCTRLGLTVKCYCEINLALEELFTNIVTYGFRDQEEHRIKFSLSYADETMTMKIEDDGVPFNPLKAGAPDLKCALEERKVGGLGIHLIKKVMDEVIHRRSGKKNILILRKRLKREDPKDKIRRNLKGEGV